jgi:hypothetical protein
MSYDVEHGEPFWEEFGEGRSDACVCGASATGEWWKDD